MTKEQLLQNTIDFFSEGYDSRKCTSPIGTCKYSPANTDQPDAEGCAIGRFLSLEAQLAYDNCKSGTINLIFKNEPELKAMAPQWMQEMDIDFLLRVQRLHDDADNLAQEGGLTIRGEHSVNYMIEQFNLDMKKF